MIPVILSGGSGTRLWPLSRPMFPKQFLPLTSEKTMFQETILRAAKVSHEDPLVIANQEHRFMAAENLKNLGYDNATIVLEEQGRNTAPAIAVACMIAIEKDPEAIVMVMPADHTIQNIAVFTAASKQAESLAKDGYLVTFGIRPENANTNYGYIEITDAMNDMAYHLKSFKEKPDAQTAQAYLDAGTYLWNSGMFVFKASVYLEELKTFKPDIVKYAELSLKNAQKDLDFLRLSTTDFDQCEDISIDYAVMEKTAKGAVVSLDAAWCDVVSWDALWSVLPKDDSGNVVQGDVSISNTHDSYIYSDNKFVSVLGAKDKIIADTKDALLVAHKDDVKNVKNVVETLKKDGRSEGQHHRKVYRPWGFYDLIDNSGMRDQVKRITVFPHKTLLPQIHDHRAEHWVVVKGTANVTKDNEIFTLNENESVFIPAGVKHALANNQDTPLEIVEVQTGDYLGEDDIVRFDGL
jgi:mannose-1-phosphate guanylyltransferase/mannose-6-phosphate isomerase